MDKYIGRVISWFGLALLLTSTSYSQPPQEAKLTANDGAPEDFFGYHVSLDGERIAVGAWGDDDKGTNSGSAYVFRWDGYQWIQEAKLTAADGAANDEFGVTLSLDSDRLVVAAQWDDDKGTNSGSVYVFRWNGSTWIQEAKLIASDGAAHDRFGWSVDLEGELIVVGAWVDDAPPL